MNLQDKTIEIQKKAVEIEKNKIEKYKEKRAFSDLLLALRKRGLSDAEIMQTGYMLGRAHSEIDLPEVDIEI
jgi:predicted CopG family antitoxin